MDYNLDRTIFLCFTLASVLLAFYFYCGIYLETADWLFNELPELLNYKEG